jgi:hypothetical protein
MPERRRERKYDPDDPEGVYADEYAEAMRIVDEELQRFYANSDEV